MTATPLHLHRLALPHFRWPELLGSVGGFAPHACEILKIWLRRHRYRRELRRLLILGPHLVEDIGLMPVHARREAAKPFWRG